MASRTGLFHQFKGMHEIIITKGMQRMLLQSHAFLSFLFVNLQKCPPEIAILDDFQMEKKPKPKDVLKTGWVS